MGQNGITEALLRKWTTKYSPKVMKGIYQRVVKSMSGVKVDVLIDNNCIPCYCPEEQAIRMPLVLSFAKDEDENFTFGRGIVIHEGSHAMFAPPMPTEDEKNNDIELMDWLNIFADVNNEYKVTQVYPNLEKPLVDKTLALVNRDKKNLSSDNPFMQVIGRCDQLIKGKVKFDYPADMNPDVQQFCEEVVKDFEDRKMFEAKGNEVLSFSKEVNEKWKKLVGVNKSNMQQFQQQMKDLYKQKGDAIKNRDGKRLSELEAKEKAMQKGIKPLYKDNKKTYSPSKLSKGNMSGIFSECTIKEVQDKVNETLGETVGIMNDGLDDTDKQIVEHIQPVPSDEVDYDSAKAVSAGKWINRMLRNKIILDKSLTAAYRSGKIDTETIRKQIAKKGMIHTQNVFRRPELESKGGEWICEILVDMSGSMRGLMDKVKEALLTLHWSFHNLPIVKYAIYGFTNEGESLKEYCIKGINQRLNIQYLNGLEGHGGTPTHEAMRESIKRLYKFQHNKRLMVIITDGEPNSRKRTKDMVHIAATRKIKLITIGIGDAICIDSFCDVFPNAVLFNDNQLAGKLSRTIVKEIMGLRK
jgi:hypothetical protein